MTRTMRTSPNSHTSHTIHFPIIALFHVEMLQTLSSGFGLSCASGCDFLGTFQAGKIAGHPQHMQHFEAHERHNDKGQLPAPSQSWTGRHQYRLSIKQTELEVYDRSQTTSIKVV